MAGLFDFKEMGTRFQDFANFILGAALFFAPWALGYVDHATAARIAWIGGGIIAVMSLAAIYKFAEWEEWVNLAVAVAVMASPYFFGFGEVMSAVMAHYVIGLLVAALSAWELWSVHHPRPRMM